MDKGFIMDAIQNYAEEYLSMPKATWPKDKKTIRATKIFTLKEVMKRLERYDGYYPLSVIFDMKEEVTEYAYEVTNNDMAKIYEIMTATCVDLIELFL